MPRLPKPRHCLIYAVALILIVLAVAFSVLRAALPYAHGYVEDLEQQLTRQIGLTTTIESIDANMDWFTPRLVLQDVSLWNEAGTETVLQFEEIGLSLAFFDSLSYRSPMVGEINLVGGDIIVERLSENRWAIQGVELSYSDEEIPEQLLALLENASYSLSHSSLRWRDHTGEFDSIDLKGVNILVENFLGEHTVELTTSLPEEYGESLRASIRFDGGFELLPSSISQVYIETRQAQLDIWMDRLHLQTPYEVTGRHDLQLWLELKQQDITGIAGAIDSKNVSIKRDDVRSHWSADAVAMEFYWKQHNNNWRAYINDFTFTRGQFKWPQATNVVMKQHEKAIQLSVDYIELAELQSILNVLLDNSQHEELLPILKMSTAGELYNIDLLYDGKRWQDAELEFVAIGLSADSSAFKLDQKFEFSGLDARMHYKDQRGAMQIVSEDVDLSIGDMFRQPLQFDHLEADLAVEISADATRILSRSISAYNKDVKTLSRLAVDITKDGEYLIDIHTSYSDANGESAHKYYPVTVMSDELVGWLDEAIQGGVVPDGGFVFYGDASQYPFEQNGTFQAEFSVNDAGLMFQQGWPMITGLDADILFDNASLYIHGKQGQSLHSKMIDTVAIIDDLYNAELKVESRIDASASNVQQYIWSSPLDEILGPAMQQIIASGPTVVDLALTVPLEDDDVVVKTRGSVSFIDNTLKYLGLGYELKELSGTIAFTQDSMAAENMSAKLDGRDVTITIGEHATKADTSTIDLSGNLAITSLLQPFDWVPSSWFAGSSDWEVSVEIPQNANQDYVDVIARSGLQGVTVNVSDVLSKARELEYPIVITTRVNDNVLQISADMPADNQLAAVREENGQWRILADTDLIVGKIDLDESFASDTTITMDLDKLLLSDLTRNSGGQASSYSLQGSQIPSMKVSGRQLVWDKWNFTSFELETAWHRLGMLVSKLELRGQDLVIDGQGSWLANWRFPHETTLKLTVNSSNLGNALSGLGYERFVDRCEQTATLDVKWPDAPYRFSWEKLTGKASLKLTDGQVTEVNPGAGGRVLGLLNVFHLPKRLFLNFGDVYKDGFVFDTISGDFDFSDGNAFTQNTEINAAAADVRILGRIGMEAEDYDLSMRVKPNQSAATFTGGTIAGGPIVGAGLVLLQKVFGLDKAIQDRYSVTGSWDNPQVTEIEKNTAQTDDEEDEDESIIE